MTLTEWFPESGAEAEFQIAFLIQKSDEILDAAEAALVEITVEVQLETVGDCVKWEIIGKLFPEIEKVLVECYLQIFPVLWGDIIRIDELYEDHELVELVLLL